MATRHLATDTPMEAPGLPERRAGGGAETAPEWYTGLTIQDFISRASHLPLLSDQEEQDLARRAQAGEQQAITTLVEHNQLLIVKEAQRYALSHPDWWPDLWQAGLIGLWRAAQKFDGRGRFSTYAVWWLRQGVNREAHRLMRSSIHIPETTEELAQKVSAARRLLAAAGTDNPTAEQIIQQAGITAADLAKVLDIPKDMILLSAALKVDGSHFHAASATDDGPLEFQEVIADPWEGTPEQEEELLAAIDQTDAWSQIAQVLTYREVEALQAYYAFEGRAAGEREQVMVRLAASWDISRSRLGSIVREALARLFQAFCLDVSGHLAPRAPDAPLQQTMKGW